MSGKDKLSSSVVTTPSVSDGSSSSSSSAPVSGSNDNNSVSESNNTITDIDLFVLAGKMAKMLVEGTNTNSDRRKVLSQLATFYQMKLVPLNTVSQGSNQILNHLSMTAETKRNQESGANAPVSKKGQPPPNPVKRDPEYMKLSSEHQTLQQHLRGLTKSTEEHTKTLTRVRELERLMTEFKNKRGRPAIEPFRAAVAAASSQS
jgi:hypothetical protein